MASQGVRAWVVRLPPVHVRVKQGLVTYMIALRLSPWYLGNIARVRLASSPAPRARSPAPSGPDERQSALDRPVP
jgi:hypothetical protein